MNSLQTQQRYPIFTSLTLNRTQNLVVKHTTNISIQIINLSKSKIDELNQKSTELNKKIKYKTIKGEDLNNYIIDITTILELILEDTYTSYSIQNLYQNPYIEAIESSLFFLLYLNTQNIEYKKDIFFDFKNNLEKRIDSLIYNKDKLFFQLYLFEYLLKKKYIYYPHHYNNFYFKEDELFNWYKENNEKIIEYLLKNSNNYGDEYIIYLSNPRNNSLHELYFRIRKKLDSL